MKSGWRAHNTHTHTHTHTHYHSLHYKRDDETGVATVARACPKLTELIVGSGGGMTDCACIERAVARGSRL